MTLSDAQIERYSRQLVLPEVGPGGQQRLLAGRVLCAGLDAAAATALLYVAAAGVGRVGLADGAPVGAADLAAPLVYPPAALGRARTAALADVVRGLAGDAEAVVVADAAHALAVEPWDLVIADDAGPALAAVNRACVARGLPLVVTGHAGGRGWVGGFAGPAPDAPCRACARSIVPPGGAADAPGELAAAAAGIAGMLAATEALKLLLGIGTAIIGRLFVYDAATPGVREIAVARDPGCPACGPGRPGA